MFQVISAMVDIVRKVQRKKKKCLKGFNYYGKWRGHVLTLRDFKEILPKRCHQGITADAFYLYIFFFGMIQATFIVYNRKWKRGFSSSGSWSSSTDSVSTLEKARTHFRDDDEFPSYLEVIRFWCCLKVFPLIFLPSGRVQTEKQLAGRGVCWLQQRNSAC